MQVYLIGSGPFDPEFFKGYVERQKVAHNDSETAFVGVDLGAKQLIDMDFPIDLAVGDFDSIEDKVYQQVAKKAVSIEKLEPMKDETDTEHALGSVADLYPNARYHLFGMLGGRVDHLLSNLWLIYQERFASIIDHVHLVEENNAVSFLRPGQHQVDRLKEMKYLSFVAMTPITDLTLKNVVYPLDNYQMPTPLALISNEFLPGQNTMKIAFSNGLILAIQARD
ncbi:thiamine diphosphokinase [Aerococcus urinaeequi]|uniref:thiamine diphosphokinase n=1 Tax=Aerococcus urinaeequi TaxID=51665 RepID=UPI0022DEF875|nr:thiamine diphosphokinase [Aerococcus urinaeequi]